MDIIEVFRKLKEYSLVKDNGEKKSIKTLNKILNKKIIKGQFGQYILEFYKRIAESGSSYDFTLMIKNLRKLEIVVVPKLRNGIMGVYDVEENAIYIDVHYLDRIDEIIYHELFHMSSAKKKNKKCYTGFLSNKLFEYFNEGYTEVLTKRYFKDKAPECPYLFEMIIAEMVENFVGQDLMEQFYSRADALGMLVEFSKYTEKQEDTYLTIQRVDKMSYYYEQQDFAHCMEECSSIIRVLIQTFIKKCMLSEEEITKEEVDYFFRMIPVSYTYEDKDYEVFSQDEVNEDKEICYKYIEKKRILKKN